MHQGCGSKNKSVRGLASSQFGHASYALTSGDLWLSILAPRNLLAEYSKDVGGVLSMCWHFSQEVDQTDIVPSPKDLTNQRKGKE